MKYTAPIATLLAVLSAIHTASATALPAAAIEVRQEYPEVIPGPGLPSLASLGLTSADLYTKKAGISLNRRGINEARGERDFCEPDSTGSYDGVVACFNYLQAIGDHECIVRKYETVKMCASQDAAIYGLGNGPDDVHNRPCRDVSLAVHRIFTMCNVDGRVGGGSSADGDINFIVQAGGSDGAVSG